VTPAESSTGLPAAVEPDTPEALEARMRATRARMRAHLVIARHAAVERTRSWPFWLVGAVAAAGLAIGLSGRASRAPARTVAKAAPPVTLAALAGWALRVAPYARGFLHRLGAIRGLRR
jgi:hypothetical protein